MRFRFVLAVMLVFAASACAQTSNAPGSATSNAWMQNLTNLPDGGPSVDADGLHNNMGSCPGEGCVVSRWQRVRGSAELRTQPTPVSAAIATLSEGEWVRAENSVHRTRPARGVVTDGQRELENQNNEGLRTGDVVYAVDYEGEGYVTVWRRGEVFSWYDVSEEGSGGILWDTLDAAQAGVDEEHGAGLWLQVQRDNGQTGWVFASAMECLDGLDPTDECSARNAAVAE